MADALTPSSSYTRSPLSEALHRKDFAIIFDWFFYYFFWGSGFGFFLILIAALPSGPEAALRILGLSFIFAGGCTICGWLLGLLFGIPRTLSRPQAAPAAADGDNKTTAPVTNRVNTNLEDISDWLTKTLVGVGLTQLYFVPHYIWQSAGKINKAGFMWEPYGQLLALSLFLYFAPGGFWLGYIGTRTILTKLFDSLEGPPDTAVTTALAPEALQIDSEGKIDPSSSIETRAADATMLNFSMTALSTSRELAAWGAAKARNNDLESATVALQEATAADPKNLFAQDALAKVYTAQKRKTDARQILKSDQVSEVAMFNALYEDPPAGYTKALAIGAELAKLPGSDKNLNLHVWLASAYGQQHAYAIETKDIDLEAASRSSVLAEVQAALKVSPARAKPLLQSLWLAGPGADNDDLSSFPPDDPDLKPLLSG